MALLKKRYRLCLEYEVEVKEHSAIPVYRAEWPDDVPGEYIVERLICVKSLLEKLMERPDVLESYLRVGAAYDLSTNSYANTLPA